MPRLRFKASRPTYRRGGLVLGSAGWVEVAIADLDTEKLLALVSDPVVQIEGLDHDGSWLRLPPEIRAEIAFKAERGDPDHPHNPPEEGHAGNGEMAGGGAEGAALSGEQYQVQTPAPAGGEGIGQADAGLVVDAGGTGDSSPANNPPVEPITPPERPATEPAASAPAKPAAKPGRQLRAARAPRSQRSAPAPKTAG